MTRGALNLLGGARTEAHNMHHGIITDLHLALAVVQSEKGTARLTLEILDVQLDVLERNLREALTALATFDVTGHMPTTQRVTNILNASNTEAMLQKVNYVGTEHVLLAIVKDEVSRAGILLRETHGVTLEACRENVRAFKNVDGRGPLIPIRDSMPTPLESGMEGTFRDR